ncbi:hypothetical protein BaRGS_00033555 [Batillaria attramentaria]|uniref:Uncharacterized protein n=1 Tax=Batillaria attramentaria TaxID=370345 RepID=A0ABD0JJX0_9CAEN
MLYVVVIDERPFVTQQLQRNSVVYAKHTLPVQCRTKLQHHVTQLRLQDWSRYQWRLPPVSFCPRQSLSSGRPRLGPRERHLEAREPSVQRRFKGDYAEDTQLLTPLTRSLTGQRMLRRPVTQLQRMAGARLGKGVTEHVWVKVLQSTAGLRCYRARLGKGVTEHVWVKVLQSMAGPRPAGDQLVDLLGNYLDLKPMLGRYEGEGESRPAFPGASNFYITHQQIAGWQTNDEKRVAELARRCSQLERSLTQLERDTDEGRSAVELFVTELHADTFDPRSWPWNVERYQTC